MKRLSGGLEVEMWLVVGVAVKGWLLWIWIIVYR